MQLYNMGISSKYLCRENSYSIHRLKPFRRRDALKCDSILIVSGRIRFNLAAKIARANPYVANIYLLWLTTMIATNDKLRCTKGIENSPSLKHFIQFR